MSDSGSVQAGEQDGRVAIIGYGLAGRVFHAPLVRATRGLHVAAIVTSDRQRSEQAHSDHPDATVYATAQALFDEASDRLDAVVIATTNESHAPLAHEAIDRGLAV